MQQCEVTSCWQLLIFPGFFLSLYYFSYTKTNITLANTRRYLDVDSTFFLTLRTSDGRQNNVVLLNGSCCLHTKTLLNYYEKEANVFQEI